MNFNPSTRRLASERGSNDATLPFKLSRESFQSECEVKSAPSNQRGLSNRITPVFQASYPGSGAKMTRFLVEAVTGLRTGGGPWKQPSNSNKVTIKTHYPLPSEIPLEHEGEIRIKAWEKFPRAIILLRNPLTAIPSYCSFSYELASELPNHSTRAPVEYWIRWRDEFFNAQLEQWSVFVKYWMDGFAPNNRTIVSFERLISPDTGPIDSYRIQNFLKFGTGINPAEKIPCIWNKVVNYHNVEGKILDANMQGKHMPKPSVSLMSASDNSTLLEHESGNTHPRVPLIPMSEVNERFLRSTMHDIEQQELENVPRKLIEGPSNTIYSLRSGPRKYPFTQDQVEKTKRALMELSSKYSNEKLLVPILDEYLYTINMLLKK